MILGHDSPPRCVRAQANQSMLTSMLMAGTFLNIGTLFSVSAMASAATASFVGASVFGLVSLVNLLKVASKQKLPSSFPASVHGRCSTLMAACACGGCHFILEVEQFSRCGGAMAALQRRGAHLSLWRSSVYQGHC